MAALKWRPRAAIAGYIDVVVSLLSIVGVIVSAVAIAVAVHKIKASRKQPAELLQEQEQQTEPEKEPEPTNKTSGYVPKSPVAGDFIVSLELVWLSIGVAAAVTALHLVAAIKMLKATEAGYDTKKAIGPTRFWVYLNIISIVISAPFYVFIFGPLGSAGYVFAVMVRVMMIYVVCCFQQELQAVTGAASNKQKNQIGPI